MQGSEYVLDSKYQSFIYILFMAILMSGVMSAVITAANIGLIDYPINFWLKSWVCSLFIAFPLIILLSPISEFLTKLVVKQDK